MSLIFALDALRDSVRRRDDSDSSTKEYSLDSYANVLATLTQFDLFSPAKGTKKVAKGSLPQSDRQGRGREVLAKSVSKSRFAKSAAVKY